MNAQPCSLVGIIESWIAPADNSRCRSRRNLSMRSQSAWPTSSSIVWLMDPALSVVSQTDPKLRACHVDAFSRGSSIPRLESKVRLPPRSSNGNAALQDRRDSFFKRDELDVWLEQYREEPRQQERLDHSGAGRRSPRNRAVARQSIAEGPKTNHRRSRGRRHRVPFLRRSAAMNSTKTSGHTSSRSRAGSWMR